MGAIESGEMRVAKNLVMEKGYTAYGAAKAAGITESAISKSSWYQMHRLRLEMAETKVINEGQNVKVVAKELKISEAAILKSRWYKNSIKGK